MRLLQYLTEIASKRAPVHIDISTNGDQEFFLAFTTHSSAKYVFSGALKDKKEDIGEVQFTKDNKLGNQHGRVYNDVGGYIIYCLDLFIRAQQPKHIIFVGADVDLEKFYTSTSFIKLIEKNINYKYHNYHGIVMFSVVNRVNENNEEQAVSILRRSLQNKTSKMVPQRTGVHELEKLNESMYLSKGCKLFVKKELSGYMYSGISKNHPKFQERLNKITLTTGKKVRQIGDCFEL